MEDDKKRREEVRRRGDTYDDMKDKKEREEVRRRGDMRWSTIRRGGRR